MDLPSSIDAVNFNRKIADLKNFSLCRVITPPTGNAGIFIMRDCAAPIYFSDDEVPYLIAAIAKNLPAANQKFFLDYLPSLDFPDNGNPNKGHLENLIYDVAETYLRNKTAAENFENMMQAVNVHASDIQKVVSSIESKKPESFGMFADAAAVLGADWQALADEIGNKYKRISQREVSILIDMMYTGMKQSRYVTYSRDEPPEIVVDHLKGHEAVRGAIENLRKHGAKVMVPGTP